MEERQGQILGKVMTFLLLVSMLLVVKESAAYVNVLTQKEIVQTQKTIVIDPGHGGNDPGKVGINQALEKDVNLEIALKLKKYLEQQDIHVVMTRQEDKGLYEETDTNKKVKDMKQRLSIMEQSKPALVVSVHQNSYPEESISGVQVFYYRDSLEGKKAAQLMQEQMIEIRAEGIAHVKLIDATPIGINVRSTVATYAGVHDELRKLYAKSPDARQKGFKASDFSYNTGSLRCPGCDGTGEVSLDVQFLPDVNIVCPDCRGSRYARAAYGVKLTNEAEQTASLPQLMDMDVNSALEFCGGIKTVSQRLQTLQQLGLGYLTLGEETPSLSGGEAQRLKLASEIGRTQTDSVFVFDEPSIGLHPLDVQVLLRVFQALLDNGATVVVIGAAPPTSVAPTRPSSRALPPSPRPEALKFVRPGMRVLDLCTGSGCVIVSILHNVSDVEGYAVDISTQALNVAKENARLNDVPVLFEHSDLFDHVTGTFDVIVSNPPYICTDEIAKLMPEVRDFEPMEALDGKEDGLYFYRGLALEGSKHLNKGGCVNELEVRKDLARRDRVVTGML